MRRRRRGNWQAPCAWLLAAWFGCGVAGGCGRPPQLGDNDKSLQATDALLTAIGVQDPKLLEQCETRLAELKDAGDLSPPAHEFLQGVVNEARAGKWDAARGNLKKFIKGQRQGG